LPNPRPQQCFDGTCADQRVELVDAFDLGEIGLQGIDLDSERLEILACLLYPGLVCDNHQIEAPLATAFGQLVADPG
jgi:hypothetical protein